VFLSDTVGFIRDLPHDLVASFLSTLDEARRADLLLHVVDAHDPDAVAHADVVEETLSRIDAGGVPRITVLNQVDRVTEPLALRVLRDRLPEAVEVSAVTGEGLDALASRVLEHLDKRARDVVVAVDAGNGKLLARLRGWGNVLDVAYEGATARVTVRLPPPLGSIRREGASCSRPTGGRSRPRSSPGIRPRARGEPGGVRPYADVTCCD
jgi:GTP-binding protein HflX